MWIFNSKDPGSRILKWRIKLEEYDYNIIYKNGKNNTNADALSRILNINVVQNDTYENYENYIKNNIIII